LLCSKPLCGQVKLPHYAIFGAKQRFMMGSGVGFQVLKPKYQTYVDTYQNYASQNPAQVQDHPIEEQDQEGEKSCLS